MNRKEFIKSSGATVLLLSLGVSLESCSSDGEEPTPAPSNTSGNPSSGVNTNIVEFSLAQAPFDVLSTDDAWLLHPTREVLLVNVSGTIRAFTSICTHQGCSDEWTFDGSFQCNCHGSRFNTSGQVINGPANAPLKEFSVTVDGDNITIDLS